MAKEPKKKVLLIGPYNSSKIRLGQYLSPPLGVYRLASHINKERLAEVDVVDPTLDYDKTIKTIKDGKYDLIGHSVLHPTIEGDLNLMWETYRLSPNSLQIAGGQGAFFNKDQILTKTPVKAVVRGFGESALENIIKKDFILENSSAPNASEGVINGDLTQRSTKEEFEKISFSLNFSKIPYPDYWDFMESQYDDKHLKAMKNKGTVKTIRLMVSNYCPLKCTHCTSTNFLKGERLIFLDPEGIDFMMGESRKAHPQVESFYFNDDNFLMMGEKKLSDLCNIIEKGPGNENLMFQGRVDEIGKESLKEMNSAGFKIGFYGVETFSNRLAKGIRKKKKGDYGEIARKTIQDTLDSGIMAQFSLMFYLPDSIEEDLITTIDYSLDLIDKGARVTIFPYVEAYSGAEIIKNHELTFKNFDVEGNNFKISNLVLPDSQSIRDLAEKSLGLKESLNQDSKWKKYEGKVPQVVDSLNLFKATHMLLGEPVSKIERILKSY